MCRRQAGVAEVKTFLLSKAEAPKVAEAVKGASPFAAGGSEEG